MATYNLNINTVNSSLTYFQAEKFIYGSSRLGILKDSVNVLGSAFGNTDSTNVTHSLGNKRYELSNHLGNVLTVITDKPIPHNNGGTVDYWQADIKSSQDYSPFGVTLSGRSFGEDSKHGMNGQEKEPEVTSGAYSAEFWMYESRLGRRWNVDPRPNISISGYATFANNPILFSDPLGDTVRNRDRQLADNMLQRISNIEKYISSSESEYGINKTMSEKDFLKSGGNKKIWNKYQIANQKHKESSSLYKDLDKRANKTQGIIDNWKKSSPNLYALVDEQATDFALSSFTFNSEFDDAYGATIPTRSVTPKSLTINIADNVNLFTKDFETNEFSLNHEAGHFLYIVKFTSVYIEYYDKGVKEGTYVKGGHGETDESGKVAKNLGQLKDIPENGFTILKEGN